MISSPQLIHRKLLRNWKDLERYGLIANFQLWSPLIIKSVLKSFLPIFKEFLRRVLEEIKLFLHKPVTFRPDFLTPIFDYQKDAILSDLDAIYAVNPHNICCYIRSLGHSIKGLKRFPQRLFLRPTVDGIIVIRKNK